MISPRITTTNSQKRMRNIALLAIISIGFFGCMACLFFIGKYKARASVTRENLKQIGLAMTMYQEQYANYPTGRKTSVESLWLLYPTALADTRCFQSPRLGSVPNETEEQGFPRVVNNVLQPVPEAFLKGTGFDYVENCNKAAGKDIQVFERRARYGGRYVLLVDKTVMWMDEDEFQRTLSEQAKARGNGLLNNK